ncbi:hypothetical protein P5673_015461 [Acropora cervicornis]|uniref:Uncharacterized protein n=1 Tax=Acropora cervicornis TaxID=6130 RepID=A0AAD9QIF3_ACRCE|nr:hypothetical protein P5673_015461 [Acropora cervicornis]
MAEVTEDNLASSESESTSGVAGSSESIDLSCIHWGYLNCTQLTDPKKIKDCIWRTYWADLCGSTIRLYRNEKKEAFIVLKKGTQVSIVEAGYEPRKSRKRLTVNRRHVFQSFLCWSRDKFSSSVISFPSTNQRRHVSLVKRSQTSIDGATQISGDVEEVYESSKKFAENPHLENLKVCG